MLTVRLVNTAWKFFSFEIVARIDQVINAPGQLVAVWLLDCLLLNHIKINVW
jgi:hypothetical protein